VYSEVTKRWVESFVVDLNLCPFAKAEVLKNSIRYTVSEVTSQEELLITLKDELVLLSNKPEIETTFLIHANTLKAFEEFNNFLDIVDQLLIEMKFQGIFQIASFHPEYQFAGSKPDAPENYTNRSPFPMLHILREKSVERAIARYGDTSRISLQNIELMDSLGKRKLQALLSRCME